jgi:hypothetical protein
MNDDDQTKLGKFNYVETLNTWRMLADIRFKLLALVPTLSSIGIGLLSQDLTNGHVPSESVFAIGILGFLVTLGVVIYDQRNSQASNAAYFLAKDLEELLGLPKGGHLQQRPARELRLFGILTMWHDRGLALIYGTVLGAWLFPVIFSALSMLGVQQVGPLSTLSAALYVSALAGVVFIAELHRLDKVASQRNSVTETQEKK